MDTKKQLKNVQSLRVVKYAYKDNFVRHAGLEGEELYDTGVIAQEVRIKSLTLMRLKKICILN